MIDLFVKNVQAGEEKYQTIVKELPTFYNGMCYIVECEMQFYPDDFGSTYSMWLTVEKNR